MQSTAQCTKPDFKSSLEDFVCAAQPFGKDKHSFINEPTYITQAHFAFRWRFRKNQLLNINTGKCRQHSDEKAQPRGLIQLPLRPQESLACPADSSCLLLWGHRHASDVFCVHRKDSGELQLERSVLKTSCQLAANCLKAPEFSGPEFVLKCSNPTPSPGPAWMQRCR